MNDTAILKNVLELDARPLLLDANQAWTSVDQALAAFEQCGDRLIGLEQPFPVERRDLYADLIGMTSVPVFGDESIVTMKDLEAAAGHFSGVNLKLMKCGGLDIALAMARKARTLGYKIMLGSMSESSLGCAAMFQLAPYAAVIDLDGPWLIRNDPFQGLKLKDGSMQLDGDTGTGVNERIPAQLNWAPIGA